MITKSLIRLYFVLLLSVCGIFLASAKEFIIGGIAYRVISSNRVEVISKGDENYKGIQLIIIPSQVKYENVVYNVYSIGNYAFKDCKSLKRVSLPSSIMSMGVGTFEGCVELRSINIPNGVTTLDDYLFLNCISLANLSVPSTVKNIGYKTFSGCTKLKSLDLSNVMVVDYYALESCSSLTDVKLSSRLRDLGDGAFKNCSGLNEIKIPREVRVVGDSTFYGCSSLRSLEIGENVSRIEPTALLGCPSLERIKVDEGNEYFADVDGILCDYDRNELICFPSNKATQYSLSGSPLIRIKKWAFRDNVSLTTLTLRTATAEIEEEAFMNCKKLEHIELPLQLRRINDRAFAGCSELRIARMRTSISYLGNNIFDGCNKMEQLHCRQRHPEIIEISPHAFDGLSASCPLYVPLNYGDIYREIDGFKRFPQIIEEDVIVPGDVNDDEVCNVSDVSAIYNYIITRGVGAYIDVEMADVNKDGYINISDVGALYKLLMGQ